MTTAAAVSNLAVVGASSGDGVPGWMRTGGELSEPHLAHADEWRTVIRDTYGHRPLYVGGEDEIGRPGVLPAFIVRRPMLGTIVSSMPFLDGGGPCTASASLADALVARLIEEARRAGAEAVEVRCRQKLGVESEPMQHKVNLVLDLPAEAGRLWAQLDGRVRNQIRKAERSGLAVEFGGAEKLDDFYAMFSTRMRELGSPVHARRFFEAIFKAFGSRARAAIVRKGPIPVGSLIALASADTLVVPWASCRREYQPLCPNMLLYWETIRTGSAAGFRRFDFGRSSVGSGTYRFKRQWGAREEPLYWYTIPLGSRGQPRPRAAAPAALLTASWRRLPLALTRRLGPHIRKYLTQ